MAKTVKPYPVAADWTLIKWRDLITVAVTGAVVGLAGLALYYMLDKYVFEQIVCRAGAAVGRCQEKATYASEVAMILAGIGALFSLVQQRVYRSLLVVLAVTVGLWNIFLVIATLPWIVMLLFAVILFGLSYAAFTWIAQVKSLVLAVVVTIILVVLLRLILG